MSKIKLGHAPKTFKSKVSIPTLDGESAEIVMTFKYRNKTDFAIFMDGIVAEHRKRLEDYEEATKPKTKKAVDVTVITAESRIKETTAENVAFILKLADGWDLEEEFNESNLTRLDNEYAGATQAIREAYQDALFEGRTKN